MANPPLKRVAITGAASGLGLALAKKYAAEGWRVALADIQDEAGEAAVKSLALAKDYAFYTHVDVCNTADLQAWRTDIERRWDGLDLLINNAGVATHGAVDEAPLEDWEWVLNINLMGVVRGCKIFIPLFKRQHHGQIVNIASMAGLVHSPEMGSYNASKAGVVAVSETLYGELAGLDIGVSVVCPGFFPTGLAKTARTTNPQVKQVIEKLFQTSRLSADDIADQIFKGAEAGRFYILPHFNYRLVWWLKRYIPELYLKSMQTTGKALLKKKRQWQRDLVNSRT
ncbi:MAG: SDR family oxidoreductase [Hahellaceae bacterium]|nr:SDR family oxidoreductase [Hahellaceae bacterium]